VAPSSHDIRVVNYVVPINPPVRGLVTEVPIEPNRPIKKGDVLFKVDPTPFEIAVRNYEAQIARLRVQLLSAEASSRNLEEQLKGATGQKEAIASKLRLSRLRMEQYKELADSGAGNRFDFEQAQASVQDLEGQLAFIAATESQARETLGAKTPEGEQDEVANVKAQIASSEADLAQARWELSQTTYLAPADGTVVALTLRPGAMAVPLPMSPAMNFVEDEQWILAIYHQNEVRKIKPGQEAEVAFKMYPGRIVKCKVDSIMWATAQGQLPIGSMNAAGGVAPIPPHSLAVRLLPDGNDEEIFLAAGAHGAGAVFTDSGHAIHILRKVLVRVGAKIDWLILKLH
jgi:multidrug resistance efflux pump